VKNYFNMHLAVDIAIRNKLLSKISTDLFWQEERFKMSICDVDIIGDHSTPKAFAKAHLQNCIFGLKICQKQAHYSAEEERYAEYIDYLTDWISDIPAPVPVEEIEDEKIVQFYKKWRNKLENQDLKNENGKMMVDAISKLAGSSTLEPEHNFEGSGMSEEHLRAEMSVVSVVGCIHHAGEDAAAIAKHDKAGSYLKDLREAATQLDKLIKEVEAVKV
jgi:hypothetical protein